MVTIDARDLRDKLKVAKLFSNPKCALPIVRNSVFQSSRNGSSLHTTNLDSHCIVTLPQSAGAPESGNVDTSLLFSLSTRLKGWVDLSADKGSVLVENGVQEYYPSSMEGEFPAIPELKPKHDGAFTLSGEVVLALFKAVESSVAKASDYSRKTMEGLSLQVADGKVCAIGTNGRVLAAASWSGKSLSRNKETSFVLFPHAVKAIKAAAKPESKVKFSLYKGDVDWVKIEVEDFTFYTRSIQGRYPDFRKVVPTQENLVSFISLDRKEMEVAVRSALLFATAKRSPGLLKFVLSPGQIDIYSDDDNPSGSCQVTVHGDTWQSESWSVIGFNGYYVLKALASMKHSERVVWRFQRENSKAGVIEPEDKGILDSHEFVLMPLKFRDGV